MLAVGATRRHFATCTIILSAAATTMLQLQIPVVSIAHLNMERILAATGSSLRRLRYPAALEFGADVPLAFVAVMLVARGGDRVRVKARLGGLQAWMIDRIRSSLGVTNDCARAVAASSADVSISGDADSLFVPWLVTSGLIGSSSAVAFMQNSRALTELGAARIARGWRAISAAIRI